MPFSKLIAVLVLAAVAIGACTRTAKSPADTRSPSTADDPAARPNFTVRFSPAPGVPIGEQFQRPGFIGVGGNLRSPDGRLLLWLDTNEALHPRLTLVNNPAGDTLAVMKNAFGPRFSPDSRILAILQWSPADDSNQVLSLLDLSRIDVPRAILPGTTVIDYEWSPDSQALAAHAHPRTSSTVTLYVVRPEFRKTYPIDSVAVALDYEFAWSPTSKWLAVLRPVSVRGEEDGNYDLILYNSVTGGVFPVSQDTPLGLVRPGWVADSVVVCPTASLDQQIEVTIRSP